MSSEFPQTFFRVSLEFLQIFLSFVNWIINWNWFDNHPHVLRVLRLLLAHLVCQFLAFLYLFQKQVLSSNVNILSNFFGHIVGISSVSVPDCPWSEEKVLDLEFCRLAAALQCGDLAKVVIC